MERTSAKRPTLGSLIPIVTGLVAVVGAVAYAIMRYSYQQFYDQFGLTPDDVGPSSAAALAQSGIRVATFVTLFALLPLALALTVSQVVATVLWSYFSRHPFLARKRPLLWLQILAELLLPIFAALAVYRGFTALTSGSRELKGQIVLGIAVLLLTSKRYADGLRRQDLSASRAAPPKPGFTQRFLRATSQLPRTAWIVAVVLAVGGALVLGGSLPRDARRTADCVIDHHQPVRWVHTHRTFLWIGSLSHMAVLQARADPAQMFSVRRLSPKSLPRRTSNAGSLVYLGNAGGRDFVYDTEQGQTLQIPDSSVVIATKPGPHCHWWEYR
jgi:hypothetical protein